MTRAGGRTAPTFFDLPPEVRDLVWRRARFESARDRVAAAPRVRPTPFRNRFCIESSGLHVDFTISATKQLVIEHHYYGPYERYLVEIIDSLLHAHIHVTVGGGVRLCLFHNVDHFWKLVAPSGSP